MKAPRPQALRTSQAIGPGIAIAILIAMGVYSYFDGEAYRSAALQAEQSRLFVQQTQEMLSLLVDAESSQRGYLLTGDLRYLAPYNAALPKIALALREIRRMGR